MFAKILLCSDGSEHSAKAAKLAAEIARLCKAEVTLLSVFSPPPPYMPVAGMGGVAIPCMDIEGNLQLAENFHEESQKEAAGILSAEHVTFESLKELGQPVDQITQVAKDIEADLIVLGSRGLGGFSRLLLGSVSDGVLHHAHCAVLIAR